VAGLGERRSVGALIKKKTGKRSGQNLAANLDISVKPRNTSSARKNFLSMFAYFAWFAISL
jgi:hypothetical protein